MSPDANYRRQTVDGRRRAFRGARSAAIGLFALSLGACEWFTDFKRQPMVTTWEQDSVLRNVRGAPQGSVPRGGTAVAGFQVSYMAAPGQIDSIARLVSNPTPVSDSSLANGHMYYEHNCAVCHGDTGQGNGPAVRYGMAGISIVNDLNKNRPDGYIWGMIRNGRGLMPPYNRIEEDDRWDVVNYVRFLQGQVTGFQVGTGAIARPGVTGDKVPGATEYGPTRPVPHLLPTLMGTPGASRAPAQGRPNESTSAGAGQPAKTGEHE